MRRPKISLKKYFYLTLIFALLLIFGFNLKERGEWKSNKTPVSQQLSAQAHRQQQKQQAQSSDSKNNHNENEIEGPDDAFLNDNVDADDDDNVNINKNKKKIVATAIATLHSEKQQHSANDADTNESTQQHQQEPAASPTSKLWFFKNGDFYPKPAPVRPKGKDKKQSSSSMPLLAHQDPHSDRIVNQLMFVPHNYEQIRESGKLKTILLYNGRGPWNVKQGRDVFLRSKCPVDTCELTANRDRANNADMILYKDYYIPTGIRRPANSKQVNMLYYLECPYHTQNVKVPDAINWTATYRRDSDIVAPYEKWVYYDSKVRQIEQDRNYALNKTKKVAWFVSNCGARNGRLQFAHELQKHIDVDIYGACGNYKCSRSTADKCFEILDHDYKFYLAFENSNCKDYITEKFFVNALNRNILPIVMGARPEDYEVGAPYRSYIHVDEFASAQELAEYLLILDKDEELYNSYFKWKGTGEFINTYYWCRVCAALHDEEALETPHWYTNVDDWWRGPGVCTMGSWRSFKARKDVITDD